MRDQHRSLAGERHAVYRLAPDLLLVFKPRGHTEAEHAHAYRQRLRILRGRLRVRTACGEEILDARSAPYVVPAGRRHATEALVDTWLVAEAAVAETPAAGTPREGSARSAPRGRRGAPSPRRSRRRLKGTAPVRRRNCQHG